MSTIIVPGDKLAIEGSSLSNTKIGPGIYKIPKSQDLIPSTAGILHVQNQSNSNNKKGTQLVYIESNTKRYIPQNNDFIIGTIVGSIGEYYKVQLQPFSSPVLLSFMAFPNATKKNRPNLKNGQSVYARVVNDDNDATFETELECFDSGNARESGGFGVLDDLGLVFDLSLNFARELLYNAQSLVLRHLASRVQFEIAVGINGRIWLKCGDGLASRNPRKDDGDGDVKMKSGNTESGMSGHNNNNNDDDDEFSFRSKNLKNLKDTLAAIDYLKRCEKVSPDQFQNELKMAFKGV
ncbi:RRP40 [Candida oxycetoniae]|uniref:RRP40 n=1 Tax=Candida oxycetoniae TaxID=497107 RepID=A0AAI9WYG2_9ASCO|nr:RRP40 [Candida oxycetoniae]KAI3405336.2 RRP40 [Candida oxycetoniae]